MGKYTKNKNVFVLKNNKKLTYESSSTLQDKLTLVMAKCTLIL